MLTYETVAAGKPSGNAALSSYYLTQSLPQEVADIARYYTKGTVRADSTDSAEGTSELRPDLHPLVVKGLGLQPERPLTKDEIGALLAGRRADGKKITGKEYSTLREYVDPKTGETKKKTPLGAIDFTLTPDKTVSVAWAFAPPAEQVIIWQAHREAAQEAMVYLEEHIARASKGKGGKDGWDPGHTAWIAFDHHTARPTLTLAVEKDGQKATEVFSVPVPGDPDLHTHFLVPNAVFVENGRVGSFDLKYLSGLIKETGALYQAHLAHQLRDRLQASVSLDPQTGMARLDAIPDEVRTHFSKRKQSGEEAARIYAKEQGLDWDTLPAKRRAGLLNAATQGTTIGADGIPRGRRRKDDMADFADWRRQAKEIGWEYTGLPPSAPQPALSPKERLQQAYEEALPWLEKALEQRAVIGVGEVRTAALRGLIAHGIENTADVNAVAELFMTQGVRQNGETTRLYAQDTPEPRQVKLTTALHVSQERTFITLAKEAAADRGDALSFVQVNRAISQTGIKFTPEQSEAIHRLAEGGRLGVMIGAAGMGKTTSLQPLVRAWTEQGRDVHGIALAWRQADELADAGIPQAHIKALSVFEGAATKGEIALSSTSVVVVDEMGLLGTRQGLALLQLQQQHGFRMVWMGDPKQLGSIEAGPIIELSRRALGAEQVPEILTTQRQQTERERTIAGLFREGKASEALAMKRQDGTAEMVPGGKADVIERVAALVKERLTANVADRRYSLTVSAPTNADAHRLGVAIRQARREMGQVGPDRLTVTAIGQGGAEYPMAIAAGDKVRLFVSTRAVGERGSIGRNGSVLTVLDADEAGMRVRNAKGREGRIAWKTLSDKAGRIRLAYGEVMTTHTAQGSTATEHIYALPSGSGAVNGFAAYSSGTRHRNASYIVVSEGIESAEVARARPINDGRKIETADAWANVAANLSRQPKKELALDLLAAAISVRKGAARSLQDGMRRIQQQGGQTHLHHKFARYRDAGALAPVVAALERTVSRQREVIERIKELAPAVAQAVRHRLERSTGPRHEHGQGHRIGH